MFSTQVSVSANRFAPVLVALLAAGCIPTTETEITIASGNSVAADAANVKSLLAELGFAEYKNLKIPNKSGRTSYETVPTTGIGVLVIEETSASRVRIIFVERNSHFTAVGLAKRNAVLERLRGTFKEKVLIVRDSGA